MRFLKRVGASAPLTPGPYSRFGGWGIELESLLIFPILDGNFRFFFSYFSRQNKEKTGKINGLI
jgi:hypothetical protein